MDFSFNLLKRDNKTRARAGEIKTPHGVIKTPAFSPVATKATVKALGDDDLLSSGTQVVLANTYHLYLRPGTEVIKKFGGFAPFMNWKGPTITDSGGYQVSFMWVPAEHKGKRTYNLGKRNISKVEERKRFDVGENEKGKIIKITDKGAWFTSYFDGSKHLLTPEKSMEIQAHLGADIIMAFDQPLGKDFSGKKRLEAFERTLKWEERSFAAWEKLQRKRKNFQALFGIIHGGTDKKMVERSVKFLSNLNFPGYAIGGETIGQVPKLTAKSLDMLEGLIEEKKPLHALGLGGGPQGIFEAVERGVDLFDNTSVTRIARTGLLFIYPEDGGKKSNKFRINIKKSEFRDDKDPVSKVCGCYTCNSYSRAFLSHLQNSGELLGLRLASIHNVYFINDLMVRLRNAININDFGGLKKDWLG